MYYKKNIINYISNNLKPPDIPFSSIWILQSSAQSTIWEDAIYFCVHDVICVTIITRYTLIYLKSYHTCLYLIHCDFRWIGVHMHYICQHVNYPLLNHSLHTCNELTCMHIIACTIHESKIRILIKLHLDFHRVRFCLMHRSWLYIKFWEFERKRILNLLVHCLEKRLPFI